MQDHSPLAPEERRKRLASMTAAFGRDVAEKLKPGAYPFEVIKRVAVGVYNDGFIHAGNLAFLALLALFPFFIVASALASLLGQSDDAAQADAPVLAQLPPGVARTLSDTFAGIRPSDLPGFVGAQLVGALVGFWLGRVLYGSREMAGRRSFQRAGKVV